VACQISSNHDPVKPTSVGTMSVTVSFCDLGNAKTQLTQLVRDTLRNDVEESDEAPFRIAIMRSPPPAGLSQIGALARKARVIILLAPEMRLNPEPKWMLLAAGAADVLDWPGQDRLAACILPRINRWARDGAIAMARGRDLVP
jgi:hypothetical protein